MEVFMLLLTCVTVISVNGQYFGIEYSHDSVPLPTRRRLIDARYEIQPSVTQEIEYQGTDTARTSNQGRRHIDKQRRGNSQSEQNYRNDYENIPAAEIRPNNRDDAFNYDNQYSSQIHQHNQENKSPLPDDSELKTNLHETYLKQNTPGYPSRDNTNTNENLSLERSYESGRVQNAFKTNRNNIPKLSSSDNLQLSVNPSARQTGRSYETSRTTSNDNVFHDNKNTASFNRRNDGNNYDNIKIPDPTRFSDIKNIKVNDNNYNNNRPNSENKMIYDNTGFENNRQSTETYRIITGHDDRLVTDGTKSTLENEITTKGHEIRPAMKDQKRVWTDESDMYTKTTVSPTLPTVDDRAAFAGGKCPTGQTKFNNICVNKD